MFFLAEIIESYRVDAVAEMKPFLHVAAGEAELAFMEIDIERIEAAVPAVSA